MENLNHVRGEVAGSFLLGISQSFANLNIFTENILKQNIDSINPTEWYPYNKLIELLNSIKENYTDASESILFRAGINFIQLWYEFGPGKQMINSGMDWLYANSESQGYNSVVRGENKNEIGWCNIRSMDEKTGIVIYENVTPLPSDLVKGVFYGGCFLFDDMEYVYIESTTEDFPENPLFIKIILKVRFRVKSKTHNLDLESKISNMDFDDTIQLNAEESECLIWQHKYLKFRNDLDKVYFKDVSKILSSATDKSVALSKELEELNATKDKFFSIIAHDLKSPFNAILGFSNILLEKYKDLNEEKRERLITALNDSAKNAFRLLGNLLTWSLSQTIGIKYTPEVLHLKKLLSETMMDVQIQACDKGIAIIDKVPETTTVFADSNLTAIILRNFISNAIKYSEKGDDVIISAREQKNGNFTEISVADTGVGIPKNRIHNLFRIGKNSSINGTANEEGTGLGLILCKEFVEKQGGEIWVESELEKGSVFKFTLPKGNTQGAQQ